MLTSGVVTFSHGVAIISRGVVTFSRGAAVLRHCVIPSLVVEWPLLVFSDLTPIQF